MAATPPQAQWIERVLGIAAATAPPPPRSAGPVLPLWRDAKETVDGQIEALGRALRGYGHPDLERIADLGLNGIGTRESVGMMRALMQFDAAPPEGRGAAAKAVRAAASAWRSLLGGSKVIALIDANPEVPVTLRTTLGRALDDIDSILDRAA